MVKIYINIFNQILLHLFKFEIRKMHQIMEMNFLLIFQFRKLKFLIFKSLYFNEFIQLKNDLKNLLLHRFN